MPDANPILEVCHGVPIRKDNFIKLRMGAVMYKTIILECQRTGLPMSKLLALSSKPCNRCDGIDVIVFNKEGEEVKVKRGILARHIPEGNGTSIINQHAKKR